MDLDRVTAELRLRRPWEAVDLGFRLTRAWWWRIVAPWAAVVLPGWALLWLLTGDSPLWALLLAWWGKPFYDRIPLFVVSRGLFGALPSLRETLGARALWRGGVLRSLTLGRFSPSRSFTLPVEVLEGQRGGARAERLRVLLPTAQDTARWLTLACLGMEWLCLLGLFGLLGLMLPETVEVGWGEHLGAYLVGEAPFWFHLLVGLLLLLAVTLVEPFYVGAGFALYLNRRTSLEGWDVEVAFRRLARRLEAGAAEGSRRRRGGRGTAAAALLAFALLAPAVKAQEAGPEARGPVTLQQAQEAVDRVLSRPEFGGEETVRRWRLKGEWEGRDQTPAPLRRPPLLVSFLGLLLEIGLWVLAAGGLAALVVFLLRRLPAAAAGEGEGGRPSPVPTSVAGLDLRPEALPADIPGAALQRLEAGEVVTALSLLYRGSLAALARQRRLEVKGSWTEDECLRHLAPRLPGAAVDYLRSLTGLWLGSAYAHRPPAAHAVRDLCLAWPGHFGGGSHRVAPPGGSSR